MITAISPIDGRYASKTQELQEYFSEYALIKYRVIVEIAYFLKLAEGNFFEINNIDKVNIQKIADNFSLENAKRIKEIESVTNHDVKAVEYFIKEEFEKIGLTDVQEFIHFGLTSQDINNTAIPLSLKESIQENIIPSWEGLVAKLKTLAEEWNAVPMLARTHGQPASPTLLGREFLVYIERFERQLNILKQSPFYGKFGGATGNFNAHYVCYPAIDWHQWAEKLLKNDLGLERLRYTTQIAHYDNLGVIFDTLARMNTILVDFCRDIWTYISMDYFKQKTKKGEVGSSAMPHKVNPIDFENAEGNLGIANALLNHFTAKLPISRLQRDLTDSTVLRNIGVPLGHILIALQSTQKGLGKLILNNNQIAADLDDNWIILAEAIQNKLRAIGYPQPYEKLKDLTRGKSAINQADLHRFVDNLAVSDDMKSELKQLTPHSYTGPVL